MGADLFKVQSFPDHEQQRYILDNFFNTQKLWVDLKKYCENNHLSEKITVDAFEDYFEQVNKDIKEKVRRFNNSIIYLTVTIFRFANYYHLWEQCSNEEEKLHLAIWYRYEARCVCNEIFMYQEKIKNLIRNLFKFGMEETKYNKVFMNKLQNLARTNQEISELYSAIKTYYKDTVVEKINKIRNDETHNDSVLDSFNNQESIAQGVTIITKPFWEISNRELYNNIKECLDKLLLVRDAIQKVIDVTVAE